MKTKKIMAALLAGVLATTAVVSVSAVTLTDVEVNGSTEVTANIVDPGSVSYTITIPASVDFGQLTKPESIENDNYKFYGFQVEATELNILEGTAVSVWVKDSCSDFATDGQFCISQKDVADPFKIQYDVYKGTVDNDNIASSTAINSSGAFGGYGYNLCNFAAGTQGTKTTVTLALNQNALYGQTLSNIAGDYSGTITFHCALIPLGG